MKNIEIVTKDGCSYCEAAKNLLRSHDLDYEEIHIVHQATKALELLRLSSQRTMPQLFIDGEPIGGYTELAQRLNPKD